MTEREKAIWTACIIDGEGWIGIRWKAKPHNSHYPVISVSNTCRAIVERLHEWWGGRVEAKRPRTARHKPSYRWALEYTRAGDLLRVVRPFLVAKNRQADLAIQVAESLKYNGKYNTIPAKVREMRHAAWAEIKELQ